MKRSLPLFCIITGIASLVLWASPDIRAQPDDDADNPYHIESSLPTLALTRLFEDRSCDFLTEKVRYAVFKPTKQTIDGKHPVIIWWHGHGEDEKRHFGELNYIDLILRNPAGKYPFYIVAVQCPPDKGWTSEVELLDGTRIDLIDATWRLVQKMVETDPAIDRDRLYLVGISTGASAIWELGARHPDAFAAICPMSSSRVSELERVAEIKSPVWAFHSEGDKISIQIPASAVEAIRRQGGTARLSSIPTVNHDSWRPAFSEFGLLEWMLQQR